LALAAWLVPSTFLADVEGLLFFKSDGFEIWPQESLIKQWYDPQMPLPLPAGILRHSDDYC
jgi:hypothetical protein